jgi:hypothetical protein
MSKAAEGAQSGLSDLELHNAISTTRRRLDTAGLSPGERESYLAQLGELGREREKRRHAELTRALVTGSASRDGDGWNGPADFGDDEDSEELVAIDSEPFGPVGRDGLPEIVRSMMPADAVRRLHELQRRPLAARPRVRQLYFGIERGHPTDLAVPGLNSGVSADEMGLIERILEALRRALERLGGDIADDLKKLFTPENLLVLAAVLAGWALSHLIGVGFVADAALMLWGWINIGWGFGTMIGHLLNFLIYAAEGDIDKAAEEFSEFVRTAGSVAVQLILTRIAGGPIKDQLKKPVTWPKRPPVPGAPEPPPVGEPTPPPGTRPRRSLFDPEHPEPLGAGPPKPPEPPSAPRPPVSQAPEPVPTPTQPRPPVGEPPPGTRPPTGPEKGTRTGGGVDPDHHNANVRIRDAEGNTSHYERQVSGGQTPAQKEMGYPKGPLESHTEPKGIASAPKPPPSGSRTITGQHPPCSSCRGKMNTSTAQDGIPWIYRWRQGGVTHRWISGLPRRAIKHWVRDPETGRWVPGGRIRSHHHGKHP